MGQIIASVHSHIYYLCICINDLYYIVNIRIDERILNEIKIYKLFSVYNMVIKNKEFDLSYYKEENADWDILEVAGLYNNIPNYCTLWNKINT